MADIDKNSRKQDPDSNWLKNGTWQEFYKDTMTDWRMGAMWLHNFGDRVPRGKLDMGIHGVDANDPPHWGTYERHRDILKKYAAKWGGSMSTEGLNFTERELKYSYEPRGEAQYPAIPTHKYQKKARYLWDDSWGEKFTQADLGKMLFNIDRLPMPGFAQWQKGMGVDPKVGDMAAIIKAGDKLDTSKYRSFGDSDASYANLKILEVEHYRRRPDLWEEKDGPGRGLSLPRESGHAGIGGSIAFKWRDFPNSLPPKTNDWLTLNSGGSVPGAGNTDSVPAMLTPGEYVINANAAAKNSALLSAINNGTAQGFNAGGPVKYMYNGGMTSSGESLSLDTREFKDATNVLSSSFGSFSQVANSISDALSSFSIGTITHEHTHTFTGSVNFDIVGSDIADELEDRLKAIGQDIAKAQVVSALEKMGGGRDPSSIAGEMRSGGTNA